MQSKAFLRVDARGIWPRGLRQCDLTRVQRSLSDPGNHARTGTLAVRSSFPQLTHAPLIARKIAFQIT